MPININCTQYINSKCTHPAVPRSRFGRFVTCIVITPIISNDPRVGTLSKCKIAVPHAKPTLPLPPPTRP